MGQMLTLSAEDGHQLAAYRATPAGTPRGGLVVVQEIFGVNSHIKKVADGWAADGYVALAPALFDRVERGVDMGYDRRRHPAGPRAPRQDLDRRQRARRARGGPGARARGPPRRRGRLLLGRDPGLARRHPHRRPVGHRGLLRRRDRRDRRGVAEVPGHAPLRRDGHRDPEGALRDGAADPPGDPRPRLSRRATASAATRAEATTSRARAWPASGPWRSSASMSASGDPRGQTLTSEPLSARRTGGPDCLEVKV